MFGELRDLLIKLPLLLLFVFFLFVYCLFLLYFCIEPDREGFGIQYFFSVFINSEQRNV